MNAAIAQIVECTEAEGPGKRCAIWFQGCPLRCPGCCNPEMLPFDPQTERPIAEVTDVISRAFDVHSIEGISLLGGEPMAHAAAGAALACYASQLRLSVMVYSGYTLAEIRSMANPAMAALLSLIDVLVDGPYIQGLPEQKRRWVGSSNQRVHFLTTRYNAGEPCWTNANTMEIRLAGNEVSVNGFPASSAKPFWRRLPVMKAKHG